MNRLIKFISLAFFMGTLIAIPGLVVATPRTDITTHGTTVEPGRLHHKPRGKLLPKCPDTHPYAINYGSQCSVIGRFFELPSSPANCIYAFSWGTPVECGVPQLVMDCPDPNGQCNAKQGYLTGTESNTCAPAMQIIYRDEEFPDGYYPLEGAFNDNGCEAYTGPTFNYFLAKDSATNYVIKLDYGCLLLFAKVKMINTNNRGGYLRGTEKFSIEGSLDGESWNFMIEEDKLDSAENLGCNTPTQEFNLGPSVARYIKITLKTFYGAGAGLRFIEFEY